MWKSVNLENIYITISVKTTTTKTQLWEAMGSALMHDKQY